MARRTFGGGGDNPMTWSLPIGSLFGITVRVSLIYILWMVLRLVQAKSIGWTYELWSLGSLFVLVLLHEFGHCLACRRVGGEADNILMWMCGGLASCRPPHNWRAALITTIGGPAVNVVLLPVFAGAMLALGAPLRALLFFPFGLDGGAALGEAWHAALSSLLDRGLPVWLIYALFTLHVANAGLLLFNLCLVFFPFDGGRIVQELLWRRYGYGKSMWLATGFGLIGAAVIGLLALFTRDFQLLLIAGFGGFTCYTQRQQLRFIGEGQGDMGLSEGGWDGGGESWKVGPSTSRASQKAAEKARKQAQQARAAAEAESAELDRILAKIKEKGMASLSGREQAFLRKTSQKGK